MAILKQSATYNKMVLMIDTADHVSGKTGLTLTITASKNGGAFASITPTVTDRGSGFYNLALTTAHTDTLGDLALHITATGADPTDIIDQVIAQDLNVANVPANVIQVNGTSQTARDLGAQLDAAVSTRMATFTLPTNFSSMSISAAGRISSDVTFWSGAAVLSPNTAGVPVVDDRSAYIRSGTLQAATGSSATLDAGASATDNIYVGQTITSAGQTRRITAYVGSTKVATLATAWTTNPGAVAYQLSAAVPSVNVGHVSGTSQTARDLGAQLDVAVSTRMATFTLPTNFSSLAITGGGAVTAGTVSDKTGYSLTQAFPTNFSSMSIDVSGRMDIIKVAGTTQTARDLGANIDATISSRLATAGYTVPPTAAAIATAVHDYVVENSKTFIQLFRGVVAAALGKASGMGTTSVAFRDNADTKNRIAATVDADGNRSAVTTDLT